MMDDATLLARIMVALYCLMVATLLILWAIS